MERNKISIVSCSGASNTGKYSDVVARQLMQSFYPVDLSIVLSVIFSIIFFLQKQFQN